jgi:hypothetical protein
MNGYFFDRNVPNKIRFNPTLPIVPGAELGGNPTDSDIWDFGILRNDMTW